ncbi:single-strand DNA-binding protein [Allostreptomyces psammosilenae]|uniref:Single-stranded DNA-binding protein n=1 Tax=Allostreptomyces psammosilenae TaxID=1892865 RepID=A0A853ACQ6_9ACTN|nr:single-strand DNA-binding protein [Allostreptomyces psammosilenae]
MATPPKSFVVPSGASMVTFRLASTPRKYDKEKGGWKDCPSSFYTVVAWKMLGENIAGSVSVGDPLMVMGRLRVREWEGDKQRHTVAEIEAISVGHDLSRGTSAFRRVVRPHADPLPPDTVTLTRTR